MENGINEVWRSIPDYPHYEISNYGLVKQADRFIKVGGRILEKKGKLIKLKGSVVDLYKNGVKETLSVNKIMKEVFSDLPDTFNRVPDLPGEEWREIEDWPGYFVSNLGRVKSVDREINYKDGKIVFRKGRLIAQFLDNKDKKKAYYKAELSKEGKSERKFVHRLVGKAFVPNPDPSRFNICNHLDENKLNNRADNIEWTDNTGNVQYSGKYCPNCRLLRENENNPVEMYRIEGRKKFVSLEKTFKNLEEAAKVTGYDIKEIIKCCLGRRRKIENFGFRLAENGSNDGNS